MLIPLQKMMKKYDIAEGLRVVHVGAHEAQEYDAYKACGFADVAWVEGNSGIAAGLLDRFENEDDQTVIFALLADEKKEVSFYEASFDQSSSILPLGTHAKVHPEVTYVGKTVQMAETLDSISDFHKLHGYEFLNLDVQGAEQMVLDGGLRFLKNCQYIYSEVNQDELYVGCTLKPEFDAFLDSLGFDCVETDMTKFGWGDRILYQAWIVKLIPLGGKKAKRKGFAEVSDEDFEWLSELNWFYRGDYASAVVDGIPVSMHSLVLGEKWVDHVDGNKTNNQRSNLRKCNASTNGMNQRPRIGGASRFKGVHWEKDRKKWGARIMVDGKYLRLGRFETEEEAARAYDDAAVEHYGEFARPNGELV